MKYVYLFLIGFFCWVMSEEYKVLMLVPILGSILFFWFLVAKAIDTMTD